MFELFLDSARQVFEIANEEAKRMGHNHVATEHLLLGLLKQNDPLLSILFERQSLTLKMVEDAIAKMSTVGKASSPPTGKLPMTQRCNKVAAHALEESRHMRQNYVSPVHIALGILREGDELGPRLLTKYGVHSETIRELITGESSDGILRLKMLGPYAHLIEINPGHEKGLDSVIAKVRELYGVMNVGSVLVLGTKKE